MLEKRGTLGLKVLTYKNPQLLREIGNFPKSTKKVKQLPYWVVTTP